MCFQWQTVQKQLYSILMYSQAYLRPRRRFDMLAQLNVVCG
jgi:hypothetical protein